MIEYKHISKNLPGMSLEELNKLGKENWELCSVETLQEWKTIIPFQPAKLVPVGKLYTFKRNIN